MKFLSKKLLSLVLACALVFSTSTLVSAVTPSQEVSEKVITLDVQSGDSIANDLYSALDEAKEYATDSVPYKIVIPSGKYYLEHEVFIYSNTTISAYGAHIINQTNGCMLQVGHLIDGVDSGYSGFSGYKNIILEGGTWDGNCYDSRYSSTVGFSNIRFAHMQNLKLLNLSVTNNVGSHHVELGGVKNVTISGCTFSGYTKDCKEAIQLDVLHNKELFNSYPKYDDSTCEDVSIYNNTFSNIPRAVGSHSAVVGKYHNNINFYNNTCTNISDKTVVAYNWINSKIYGNTFTNVGAGVDFKFMDAPNYYKANSIAQNVSLKVASNSEISGNTISLKYYSNTSSSCVYGIRIGGEVVTNSNNKNKINNGTYKISNVSVLKNNISGYVKFPIRLEYADYCTVNSNSTDSSNTPSSITNARSLSLAYSSHNTISGNSFKNLKNSDANCIQIELSSNNNTLSNNNLSNIGKAGISINGASGNTVKNGKIEYCKQQGITISNNAKSNTIDSVTINNCSNNAISINTANSTYVNNCSIYKSSLRGINVTSSKSVSITKNKIANCSDVGLSLNTKSSVSNLKGNILTSNGSSNALSVSSDSSSPVNSLKNTILNQGSTGSNYVTGYAKPNSTITVYKGSSSIGSTKSSSNGYFKVTFSKPSTTCTLVVSAKDSQSNQACDTFTFNAPNPSSVSLSPSSLTLGVSESYTLKATVSPKGSDSTLTYSTNNPSVASVSGGKITAKGVGTATITVKTKNGKYAYCKVTVKPAPSSVKINPSSSITLGKGEKLTISESTNGGSWASADNLKWSSSNSNTVSVSKSSSNKAVITAKNTGSATITIKLYNGKYATCKVTVKPAPSSVKINPSSSITLGKGEKLTISESTNGGSWASADNLKWSSSNSNTVSVSKSSSNKAVITAKNTGSATITIKLYNGKYASCKVYVKPAPTSVKINPSSTTMKVGEAVTISESTNSGSWASADNLKWSSSDSNIVSVSKSSKNKAIITAKNTGLATITIKLYNGKYATCTVTVQ